MSDPRSLLRAAEAELGRAEALASQWREAVTALRKVVGRQAEIAPPAVKDGGDLAALSGPKAAESVLREEGGPLRIKEIVRRMQAGGFRPDENPNKIKGALYTNLMRSDRFKRVGRGKFDLAHRGA